MRRTSVALIIAILSSVALADDFVGQASVIDGDTLEIHGVRIRLWGIDAPESSQLCRGDDSLQYRCGAQAANDLDAFIGRSAVVFQSASTRMAARSRPARSQARISVVGLYATVLRWIGPNTRRAGITKLSARLSARAEDSGRAALSSRGSIVHASAQVESRPPVRTMQMPILYAIPARRQSRTGVSQSRHLGRWLWRRLGCSRYPSFPIPSLHNGNEMVAATGELPASGCALEVDGRLKAEFATRGGARAGGRTKEAFSHASDQDRRRADQCARGNLGPPT